MTNDPTGVPNMFATLARQPAAGVAAFDVAALALAAIAVVAAVTAMVVAARSKRPELPPAIAQPAGRVGAVAAPRAPLPVELLVEHCADALMVVESDGLVSAANPAVDVVFGHASRLLRGLPFSVIVAEEHQPIADGRIRSALAMPPGATTTFEIDVVAGDKSIRPAQVVAVRCGGEGEASCLVLTLRDIADFRSIEAQLEHQAFHDALTGLPNRSLFLNRLDQAMRRRTHVDMAPTAVLYLDLDGFKAVNDTRGHHAGDELLQAVGYRLVGCLRGGDTVARMGGDEFAVLLEDGASTDDALAVASRILEVLALPLDVDGEPLAVQASVGLAVAVPDATPESLLRSADLAMLRAKQAGKARVMMHDVS